MSNDFFRFKQFAVWQDKCAMKVGTDGVLLGAWANGGRCMLDIGSGTALVSLMLAQRFPQGQVVGVEIDHDACEQARQNVALSPFKARVSICESAIQTYTPEGEIHSFDCIVSNPPFFQHSLSSPDLKRNLARHSDTLSYGDLFQAVDRLLSSDGEFSVVIPADCRSAFETESVMWGFFLSRICSVRTVAHKPPKRYLLAFRHHPSEVVQSSDLVIHSEQYNRLVKDFYINL